MSRIGDVNKIHQDPVITIYIKLGQSVDFVQTQILALSVHRLLKSILTFSSKKFYSSPDH